MLNTINTHLQKLFPTARLVSSPRQQRPSSFLLAFAAVALMTGIITVVHADTNMVSIPPLFLLVVQGVAVFLGSRCAVFAAFASFLAFDWFFVEPRYQLTVRDPFEFVALCVFLVTAILVGQLTALFQNRAQIARKRELAASALATASWTVSSELNRDSALARVLDQLANVSSVQRACILLEQEDKDFIVARYNRASSPVERGELSDEAVQLVRETRQSIGWDNSEHWQKALLTGNVKPVYLPVCSDGQMLALFYAELTADNNWSDEEKQTIESLINLIAVVFQRDQLMETKAKAQALTETNRLTTALLQMVSHDFKSPLASIKASVTSLLVEEGEPLDGATQNSLLQAIEAETDRLNRMVGNILDLSRLEADAWQPQKELWMISELIGNVLDTMTGAENERIRLELSDGNSEIYVDCVQFVQALRNLLENALKYSPRHAPVELHSSINNNGEATIEVLDRGPGLPPGEEKRLFEPFYRAVKHSETSVPGMGMGLAIAKGLIEAQGGQLKACNRPGGGAIFCISVALAGEPTESGALLPAKATS